MAPRLSSSHRKQKFVWSKVVCHIKDSTSNQHESFDIGLLINVDFNRDCINYQELCHNGFKSHPCKSHKNANVS